MRMANGSNSGSWSVSLPGIRSLTRPPVGGPSFVGATSALPAPSSRVEGRQRLALSFRANVQL
jgi:hypothetical protein